jgi:hypothetical protein
MKLISILTLGEFNILPSVLPAWAIRTPKSLYNWDVRISSSRTYKDIW